MATYQQWRRRADVKDIKRVTYVCGVERVLVEEVVATTRRTLDVSEMNFVSFVVGESTERDIWSSAHQYPLDIDAKRLIVVRNAEKLRNWNSLVSWSDISRFIPAVYLLFVSNEKDLADASAKEIVAKRGSVVRCSTLNYEDLTKWTQLRVPLDANGVRHLIQRSGGDLRTISNVAAKIAPLDKSVSLAVIDALCEQVPADSFSDLLILGDKKGALLALERLPEKDYSLVVGSLEYRIDAMSQIWAAVMAKQTVREISIARVVPPYLLTKFYGVAKDYSPSSVSYRRRVLAICDNALRSGVRESVLELLVALW